jgi:DNA-directed RNA polymerase specialized sigma24 family protein
MEHLRTIGLLDSDGQPFHPRIERVLIQLLPRLRREFPSLQDEVGLAEIMEEAGRRIRHREQRGPIERLHGYAWVTIRSIATSRMRLGSTKLHQKTLDSDAGHARLLATPTSRGSVAEVEQAVLLRELLRTLSREERMICLWKKAGFSSQEIALHQRRTVVSVDTIFSRAKQKIRKALGIDEACEEPARRSC